MDNLPIVKKNGAGVENTPLDGLSRCATRVGPYPVFLYRARAGALSSSNLYFRVSCQISKMELEKRVARSRGDGDARPAARETHPGENPLPGCR